MSVQKKNSEDPKIFYQAAKLPTDQMAKFRKAFNEMFKANGKPEWRNMIKDNDKSNESLATTIIAGIEFADECPEKCPGKVEYLGQGGLCYRCPVFNCIGEDPLVHPDGYRLEWAKAWRKWFDSGMESYPQLKL